MAAPAKKYDINTIILHWLTALIVFFQFISAELWGFLARPQRHFLVVSHMSLGFLLVIILTLRIVWRLSYGIRLPQIAPTLLDRGARLLHLVLYGLLAAQMPLGFFTRWTDNKPLDVFGWAIASPLGTFSKATGHFVDQVHDINAWIIMALVGLHAFAALIHHYLRRDAVLRRMLPGFRAHR